MARGIGLRVFRAGALLAAVVLGAAPGAAGEAVKLSLNFLPHGGHIGFFVAREQGFYREPGREVEILKEEGSADAVRRMASGVVDFAFADLGSLVVGRSRGLKVDAIATYVSSVPSCEIQARTIGQEVFIMFYADFGVDTYGAGIITSEQMLEERPDLVRRFVQASRPPPHPLRRQGGGRPL